MAEYPSIPDHRELGEEGIVVQAASEHGEVTIVVSDGAIQQLHLDPEWVAQTAADPAADLIAATVNRALTEWYEQQHAKMRELLGDLTQLHASLAALRADNPDGWVASLADHRRGTER